MPKSYGQTNLQHFDEFRMNYKLAVTDVLDATPEDNISKLIKGRTEFITSRLGKQLYAAGDVIEVRINRLRHLFKEEIVMSTSCSHPKVFLSLHVEEGAAVCSKEGPQDLLSHLETPRCTFAVTTVLTAPFSADEHDLHCAPKVEIRSPSLRRFGLGIPNVSRAWEPVPSHPPPLSALRYKMKDSEGYCEHPRPFGTGLPPDPQDN